MDPTPPDLSRAFRFALPVALGMPLFGVGLVCTLNKASVSLVFTLVAVVTLVVLIVATRSKSPRAGIVGAVAVACWWLVGGTAATIKVDVPLVWAPSSLHCGTAMMSFLLIAGPLAGFASVAGGLGLGALAVRRRLDGALRKLATFATAVALVVLAFELPKLRLPEPDDYVASLEPTRAVDENGSLEIHARTFHYVRRPVPPSRWDNRPAAEITEERCDLLGGSEDVPMQDATVATIATVEKSAPCPSTRFRMDPKLDVLVIESRARACPGDGCWSTVTALRTSDWSITEITVRSAAHRLAAPTGWRISGVFGAVVALVALLLASRLRKQASAVGLIDAQHLGGGNVVVSSTPAPLLVPVAASLPMGPIVLDGEEQGLPTYREVGGPRYARAVAGSLADYRARRTDVAASLTALALAAAALGSAPLAAVRLLYGL